MIILPASRFRVASRISRRAPASVPARVGLDLRENVLPFWAARCKDEKHGGYFTHFDARGRPSAVADKFAIMHARIAWFLSAAFRHGLAGPGHLDLARWGVEYLMRSMWDSAHGGFFFTVGEDGAPRDAAKRLSVHCFAIYAFSEYSLASGDASAREWAENTFQLLQSRFRAKGGGYRSTFTRDWKDAGGLERSAHSSDYLLHVMECLTVLAVTTGKREHKDALKEVVDILVRRALDSKHGCVVDELDEEWRPCASYRGRVITRFGINAELAWLLLDAARALGEPEKQYEPIVRRLVDYNLQYGFDGKRGGIAAFAPIGVRAAAGFPDRARTLKIWWPQAEMMVALVEAYRLTGDRRYLDAFARQFGWIWKYQIDHRHGEWFCNLNWSGTLVLSAEKGSGWKGPYHNGRALMRVEATLRELGFEDWRR